jgi:hypothetical protein
MKAFVTVPNRGWVHRQVMGLMVRIVAEREWGIDYDAPVYPPPYDSAMNILAKRFYEGDCDFWLNIDADNPPVDNPLKFMALDKDILGFPTPGLSETESPMVHPMSFRIVEGRHVPVRNGKGLERVDAVSSGAMLISRRVFENPAMRRHPFLSVYNEAGIRTHGPDIMFCQRARENGFEIWSHFDCPSLHYKEVELGELMGRL